MKNVSKVLKCIVTLCLLIACNSVHSQIFKQLKDSVLIYQNIQTFSKQNAYSIFIYHLIFVPPKVYKNTDNKVVQSKKEIKKVSYDGKIIRKIIIQTQDPFYFSSGNSYNATEKNQADKGNKIHIKTQKLTVKNLILFKENEIYDLFLIQESERLIRSQKYVREISIDVIPVSKNSDSIDVYIHEIDNWSLIPFFSITKSKQNFRGIEKNFLGLGHEFSNGISRYNNSDLYKYYFNYYIPNIKNTYINTTLHYGTDENRNFIKSIAFERPLFSPLAQWTSGIKFSQQNLIDSVWVLDVGYVTQKYRFNTQDYWLGYAIPIFKHSSKKDRTTSLIMSARYAQISILENPINLIEARLLYTDEKLYFVSLGISTRKNKKDKYLFKYGVTEDIPFGHTFNVTTGYQIKNNIRRQYVRGSASWGNYFDWGYVSTTCEYGTFIRAAKPEQGILSGTIIYFTPLQRIGKWKFRQFIKPNVTVGLHRFLYDSLTLNNDNGLPGFSTRKISGTSRLLLTYQTQSYAPWNIVGFHFGPYLSYTMGMVGNEQSGFKNSKVYTQLGIGVLCKNQNLIFNTFQISIAFYPNIPGIGNNIFKMNANNTADFELYDFKINKPETMLFQ